MNQVSIYRGKKIMNFDNFFLKKNLIYNEIIEFKLVIRIRTTNQIQPRVTHYPQSIFSLRLLQLHSRLSTRVSHTPFLPNQNAPRVHLLAGSTLLSGFNISLIPFIIQQSSTPHWSKTTC